MWTDCMSAKHFHFRPSGFFTVKRHYGTIFQLLRVSEGTNVIRFREKREAALLCCCSAPTIRSEWGCGVKGHQHCENGSSNGEKQGRASIDWRRDPSGCSSSGVSEWRSHVEAALGNRKNWRKYCFCFFFSLSLGMQRSALFDFPDGSAIFKGCFHRPDNVTLALPFRVSIQNMSVDKCVDTCTEKVRWFPVAHDSLSRRL